MEEDGFTKKEKESPPKPSRHPKATCLWLPDGVESPESLECLTLMQRIL